MQCRDTGDTKMLMALTEQTGRSKTALGKTEEKKLIFWLGTGEEYNGRRYTGRNGNKECRI